MSAPTVKDSLMVADLITRQEARKEAVKNLVKHTPKIRSKPIRFTRDDVNEAVASALRDASREIRHQIKETPGWGRALCWACAKLEDRAALNASRLALKEAP